jgi:hypothetical protein
VRFLFDMLVGGGTKVDKKNFHSCVERKMRRKSPGNEGRVFGTTKNLFC